MAELLDHLRELNKESEQASHTSTDSSPMLSKKAKVSLFTVAATLLGSIKSSFAAIVTKPAAGASAIDQYNFVKSISGSAAVDPSLSALGIVKNSAGEYVLKLKDGSYFVGPLDKLKTLISSKSPLLPSNLASTSPSAPVDTVSQKNDLFSPYSQNNPINLMNQGTQGYSQMKGMMDKLNPNSGTPKAPPTSQNIYSAGEKGLSQSVSAKTPNLNAAPPSDLNTISATKTSISSGAPSASTTNISSSNVFPYQTGTNGQQIFYDPTSSTGNYWVNKHGLAVDSTTGDLVNKLPMASIKPFKIPELGFGPNFNFASIRVNQVNNLPVTDKLKDILKRNAGIDPKTGEYYKLDPETLKPIIPQDAQQSVGVFSKIKSFDWKGVASGVASVASGVGLYYSAKSFDPKNMGSYLSLGLTAASTGMSLATFFATSMGTHVLGGLNWMLGLMKIGALTGPQMAIVVAAVIVAVAIISKLFGRRKEREMDQSGKDLASLADTLDAGTAGSTTLAIASGVALNGMVMTTGTNIPTRQIWAVPQTQRAILYDRLNKLDLKDSAGNTLSNANPENTVYVHRENGVDRAVSVVVNDGNETRLLTDSITGNTNTVTSQKDPTDNYITAMTGTPVTDRNGRVVGVRNAVNRDFAASVIAQRRLAEAAAQSSGVTGRNILNRAIEHGKDVTAQ